MSMVEEISRLFEVDLCDVWFRFNPGICWSGSIMANSIEKMSLSLDWYYHDCIPSQTVCTNVSALIQVVIPSKSKKRRMKFRKLESCLHVALNTASTLGHEICHYIDLIEGREQNEATAYAWEEYFLDNWPDFKLEAVWALGKEMKKRDWFKLFRGDKKDEETE